MEEIYTVKEAAKKLKCATSTVYEMVANGSLKHTKIKGKGLTGKNIRILESDLMKLLVREEK